MFTDETVECPSSFFPLFAGEKAVDDKSIRRDREFYEFEQPPDLRWRRSRAEMLDVFNGRPDDGIILVGKGRKGNSVAIVVWCWGHGKILHWVQNDNPLSGFVETAQSDMPARLMLARMAI